MVGNEAVAFNGTGRSYGAEVLLQQRLYQGFYGLLAYTFVRSDYAIDGGDSYPQLGQPAHLECHGRQEIKDGWEIGSRLLFSGGLPYTPVDMESLAVETWNFYGRPLLDWPAQHRTQRCVSPVEYPKQETVFRRWSLDVFVELQNATGAAVCSPRSSAWSAATQWSARAVRHPARVLRCARWIRARACRHWA